MQPVRLKRSRLNDRLARAALFPIAVIVAPAGFGKSIALRDFLLSSRMDAVRFDVRREERSLLAFARRFSEVVEPLAPSAAASFIALQERILSANERPRLVSDWFAEHLKRTIGTIVIDDLHFAAADPDSIAFLAELVDRTSERIKWIVASRSDAGLPIATWLAYGRMDLPVDQHDLQFTMEEAFAAAQTAQTDVRPDEVASLWRLTDGWPVALAIALRTHTQAAELRTAATREMIYRYLAEQVFARLSAAQREFLLATSIFSTFDVTTAQALSGTAEFIEDLRHGVAFLTETSPGHYRYHDLFRDYLESELRRRGDEAWHGALSTGAQLLEQRGHVDAALALYTKARDPVAILRIIESDGFQLFEQGRAETLATALEAVPDERRRESPVALGVQATLESARGHFEPACRGFVAAIERADRHELRLALVHRYAIEVVRQGGDSIRLLEAHTGDGNAPAALRVPLLGTLATAYARAARIDDAVTTIATALEHLDPTAGDDIRARVYQQAAYVYSHGSNHDLARRYATLSVELALARNFYEVAVRAYSVLYQLTYDHNDDPIACLSLLDKLLDCAGKGASSQGKLYGLMASYDIEADRGNDVALDRIEASLAGIPEMLERNRNEALLPAMALRAAWRRDFRRAYELLSGVAEHQNDERRAEHFSEVALYACAAGMPDEADAAQTMAATALFEWDRPTRRALRARLLLAITELTRGRATAAHRHLAHAKRTLDPSMPRLGALLHAGIMFYRYSLGEADKALIAGALERLRAEEFGGLARLLEALDIPGSTAGGYAALSATEREILQLLAAGGSTRDMAERTSRSPRTIDTHIRSICKKLNCRSRRAVVALAIGSGWVHDETNKQVD